MADIDEGYTGFAIVRLADPLGASKGISLDEVLREDPRTRLMDLLSNYGSPPIRRLVESVPLEVLLELDDKAAHSRRPPIFRMGSFWQVDFRENFAAAREFVARALELEEVGNAYLQGTVRTAALVPDPLGNPRYQQGKQGYLRPAKEGIDAPFAWLHAGGDGQGIGVVDCEGDWNFDHQDIIDRGVICRIGTRTGTDHDKNHGTAVLGTMLAANNGKGGIGVAPGVTVVNAVSWSFPPATHSNIPAAMTFALHNLMDARDIFVLEAETASDPGPGWPVELRDEDFAATQLLTSNDMIVIAAAGNGPQSWWRGAYDLDSEVPASHPARAFDRTFRDSGAILVGSCLPGAAPGFSHEPHPDSNRGTRIDCYAWGAGVDTSYCEGFLEFFGGVTNDCYGKFDGTSAATAIIAGAALCVQGIAQAGSGRLDPLQMRVLLSDFATGTESKGGILDKIGVMPDLRQVLTKAGLVPNV